MDIFQAIINNDLESVKQVVENGANVNIEKMHGWTAVMWASHYGYLEILDYLVENGAFINVQDEDGQTPLMEASFKGYLDIVEYLISKNADRNIKNNNGKKALDYANEHKEIVELLEFIEEIEKNKQDLDKIIQNLLDDRDRDGHIKIKLSVEYFPLLQEVLENKGILQDIYINEHDKFQAKLTYGRLFYATNFDSKVSYDD